MLIVPLGLVSKTKNIPFATIVIVSVTVFYSIIQFPKLDNSDDYFWNSPGRADYAESAKAYISDKCYRFQGESFCGAIQKVPAKYYLFFEDFGQLKSAYNMNDNQVIYVLDELSPKKLEQENPELLTKRQLARTEIETYAKKRRLLRGSNLNVLSALHSLFLHGGWAHLLGNLLILIFIAFPVEERMGSLFFGITYLISGVVGSGLHVYLDPDAFYLVGASSSISGIAGAMTLFFWRNHAKVFASFFLIFSQTITIPVLIYAPIFMMAGDLIGAIDSTSNVAYVAHLGGFTVGAAMALLYNLLVPLPKHFTYPFELNFHAKSKASLSQLDRIKVLNEWLYYTPINLRAFKKLVIEIERSDLNDLVEKEINNFKKKILPEVYHVNRKVQRFHELLPVEWLLAIPHGDDPGRLQKQAANAEEKREFATAFKLYFLALNELGWKNTEVVKHLNRNCTKASIDANFKRDVSLMREKHTQLNAVLPHEDYDVLSA